MKIACSQIASFIAVTLCATALHGAPLSTVQNSTLSVPAANIAAPGSTNLVGSNFLMSSVSSPTAQGGWARLVNSQRWVQRYPVGSQSSQSTANGMVIRRDGTVVVTGSSQRFAIGDDFLTICYSADGQPLWTNLYDGPLHKDDTAYNVVANAAGEVWVTGISVRNETNSQLIDVALIKYASNGAPAWTNRYNSAATNADYPQAIVVDSTGNAYLVMYSVYWPPGQYGGFPLGETIIKYDPFGTPLRTNSYPVSAPDSGQGLHEVDAVALGEDGSLFAAGNSGSEHYNTGTALVKFGADGTAVWTNFQAFPFMSLVRSVVVDRLGDVVLTGETFIKSVLIYVAMKVSSAGVPLWTNSMIGPTYDGGGMPQTLLDPKGNVLLIGGSSGTASPGLYSIMKLSNDGKPLWTNPTATVQIDSIFYTAAVDNAGSLYLAGYSPYPATNNSDFLIVKYSGDGLPLCTNRFNGGASRNDFPAASALDGAGNLYVAGEAHDVAGSELTVVKYADLMFYSPPKDFIGSDTISYAVTDNFGNQATGTVSVVVSPGAFRLSVSSATNFTSSGFRFKVDGAPGTNAIIIEGSSDLAHWQPLVTNQPAGGSAQPLDPGATSFQYRFYRAVQQQ